MLDTTSLTLFFVTAFVIPVTPGLAVLYIIARGVTTAVTGRNRK